MHGNDNKNFLTDRERVEHAVPFMLMALMIFNAIKHMEAEKKAAGEQMLREVHDHVNSLITSDTLRRRAERVYHFLSNWMMKGRFSVRKSIFVILQFTAHLKDHKVIKIDENSKLFDYLCLLSASYDDSLEEELGEDYQKFERSGLRAVYELGIKMQSLGYFQKTHFVRGTAEEAA